MRLVLLVLGLTAAACSTVPPGAPGEYIGPSAAERARHSKLPVLGAAELQLYVVPFNRRVRNLPGFSDLYINHEPSWHVVVAFTKPPPRERVLAMAPPLIRDRILIRTAKRSQAEIAADLDAIAAALRATGIAFTGGYDPRRQRFGITVGDPAHVSPVRSALPPQVRSDTDVSVGPLPVPE